MSPVKLPDSFLWPLAAVVVLVGLVFLWRARQSVWKPLFIVTITGLALVFVFLLSASVNLLFFEAFFAKTAAWYFVAALAWLYIRLFLPHALAKYQAQGIMIIGGVLSFVLLILSLLWWLEAVDINAHRKNPVVRTSPELKEQWDLGYGMRPRGIFVTGFIGDPAKRTETASSHSDFIAYYTGRTPGGISSSAASNYFPTQYDLTLSDDTKVSVQGIDTVRKTHHWPEGGPRNWQHGLRNGDPVIIWADPGETLSMTSGEKSLALNGTRVVAYGTFEDFQNTFITPGVRTARVFGWLAFALIPLSFIPFVLGYRRFKWLRKHGSDIAPPTGTKSLWQ